MSRKTFVVNSLDFTAKIVTPRANNAKLSKSPRNLNISQSKKSIPDFSEINISHLRDEINDLKKSVQLYDERIMTYDDQIQELREKNKILEEKLRQVTIEKEEIEEKLVQNSPEILTLPDEPNRENPMLRSGIVELDQSIHEMNETFHPPAPQINLTKTELFNENEYLKRQNAILQWKLDKISHAIYKCKHDSSDEEFG